MRTHEKWTFRYLAVLILLTSKALYAQVSEADLTWRRSAKYLPADTATINRILANAVNITYDYPDSARTLVEFSYKASKHANYHLGMAQALILLGRLDENSGDHIQAVRNFREAIPHLLETKSTIRIAVPYINIANAFFFKGEYDEALKAYYEALSAGKKHDLAMTVKDSIRIYLNIALAWDAMGGKRQAAEALHVAESMPQMFKDSIDLADYYSYAAHIYAEDDPQKAIDFHQKALKIANAQQSNSVTLPSLNTIASIYIETGQADSAMRYLDRSKAILDSHPNAYNYNRYHYRHQLGRVLLLQGKLKQADSVLTELYSDIQRIGLMDVVIDVEKDLVQLYEKMGAYNLALIHSKNYARLRDTLFQAKNSRAVALWSQLHEAESKTKLMAGELEISRQRISLQRRNIIIGIVVAASSLLALALFVILKNQRIKHKKQQDELLKLQQSIEIERLKAQINGEEKERGRLAIELHDNIGGLLSAAIYNLESNRNSNTDGRYDTLKGIMKKVRSEVRKASHKLMPDILLGLSLSEAVSQYCAFIEQETGLEIILQEQGNFGYLNIDIKLSLYRIIQELIQNILKHANATNVLLQLRVDSDMVSLTIEDNGSGFQQAEFREGQGIKSVKERLRAIGGSVSYSSEYAKGTSVYIELPLNNE